MGAPTEDLICAAGPAKSSAAGQYFGYSLQQTRLCHHLLKAPDGEHVSLEFLDDVAVHHADGTILLEQSKSAPSGNPVADRATDLWKTLANWADVCSEGKADALTTRFRLYVTPNKTGTFVRVLHKAETEDDAKAALAKARKFYDKKNPTVGCNPHIERFLSAGPELGCQIIAGFELQTEADPKEAVRDCLRALVPSETLDRFCTVAVGMARDEIDRLIHENKPRIISATFFRKGFHAFIRKYNLSALLEPTCPAPTDVQLSAVVDTSPLFVRQLQVIEAKPDMLMTAVSDFLRTSADKINWAEEGLIVEGSLNELDVQLQRQHKVLRDEVEDTAAEQQETVRGRTLYRKCAATVLPLEGRPLPQYFIPGEYNALADDRKLGWHPNYLTLFPEEG